MVTNNYWRIKPVQQEFSSYYQTVTSNCILSMLSASSVQYVPSLIQPHAYSVQNCYLESKPHKQYTVNALSVSSAVVLYVISWCLLLWDWKLWTSQFDFLQNFSLNRTLYAVFSLLFFLSSLCRNRHRFRSQKMQKIANKGSFDTQSGLFINIIISLASDSIKIPRKLFIIFILKFLLYNVVIRVSLHFFKLISGR